MRNFKPRHRNRKYSRKFARKSNKSPDKIIRPGDLFFFKKEIRAYSVDDETGEHNENIMRIFYSDDPCIYVKTKKRGRRTYHYFTEAGLSHVYVGPFRDLIKSTARKNRNGNRQAKS